VQDEVARVEILTPEGLVIRPQPGPEQRFLRSRADIAI
jgi:hypothetical protein